MKVQLKADLMLILVTLCWGVSYYLMDVALADMGAFTLNAHRFLGAFLIAAILAFKKLKNVNKITLLYSLIIGTIVTFVYLGATFGVQYTTLSNTGFLCALNVIFVPIFELIFLRKRQEKKIVVAVTMCFIGIMLLTLKDNFSFNMSHIKGDLLSLLCAVAYAVDLIVTEKAVSNEKVNPFQLGVFQLAVTGVFNIILAFAFETPHFPTSLPIWGSVIFLSIFCTGVAFIVQTLAQQYTTAAHVGIIFTLEPVFAGIVAFFIAGEVLSAKAYIGAIIMVSALFLTEIDISKLFKGKNKTAAEIEKLDETRANNLENPENAESDGIKTVND